MPQRAIQDIEELNAKFNILDAKHDFPSKMTIRGRTSYTIQDGTYNNMKKGFDTCLKDLFKGLTERGIPNLHLYFTVISAKSDIPSTVTLASKPSILRDFKYGIQDTVTPMKFGLERKIGPSHYFDTASHKYGTDEFSKLQEYYGGYDVTTDLKKFGIDGTLNSYLENNNIHFEFSLNNSLNNSGISFNVQIDSNGNVLNGLDIINGNANFANWLEQNLGTSSITTGVKTECKKRILGKLLGDLYYLIDLHEMDSDTHKIQTLVCTKDSYLCDRVLFNQIGGGVLMLRGIKGNDVWSYGEEGVDNPDGVLLIDLYSSGNVKSRTSAGSTREKASSILYYVLYDSPRLLEWDATYGGSKNQMGGDGSKNTYYNQCSVDDLIGEIQIVRDNLNSYESYKKTGIIELLESLKTKLMNKELGLNMTLDPIEFKRAISIYVPAQLLFKMGEILKPTLEPTLEPKIFPFLSDEQFKGIFGEEKTNINPLVVPVDSKFIASKPDNAKLWDITKKIVMKLTGSNDLKLFVEKTNYGKLPDEYVGGKRIKPVTRTQKTSTEEFKGKVEEISITINQSTNIYYLYKTINSLIEAGYFDCDQFIEQLFLELTNENQKAAYSFYYLLRGLMFFDGYYIVDIIGIYNFIGLAYDSTTSLFRTDIPALTEYLNKIREADKKTREADENYKNDEKFLITEDLIKGDQISEAPQILFKDVDKRLFSQSSPNLTRQLPNLTEQPPMSRRSSISSIFSQLPRPPRHGGKKQTLKKRGTRRSKSKQPKNKRTRRYKKTP